MYGYFRCGRGPRFFMGRRYGGRGFGHFAGGFGGAPGFGGGGFRMGRKLASADLQLLVLALLAEKPCHGYELIKALEERSGGFYSPSPGMIYPALTYLEEIGHAVVEVEGTRKRYRITDEGRRHLEQNRAIVDAILTQLDHISRRMEGVRRAFAGEDWVEENEDLGSRRRSFHDVWAARRELAMALHEARHASPAEHQRIAEILRRAVAEIRNKPASS